MHLGFDWQRVGEVLVYVLYDMLKKSGGGNHLISNTPEIF